MLTGRLPHAAQLARNPFPKDGRVVPEKYLEAAGECFILMIGVSWALTMAFNPDVTRDNKLLDRVGYNNMCVGFDSPPARYVAMPLQVLMAYLAARYASLDTTRAMEQKQVTAWLARHCDELQQLKSCGPRAGRERLKAWLGDYYARMERGRVRSFSEDARGGRSASVDEARAWPYLVLQQLERVQRLLKEEPAASLGDTIEDAFEPYKARAALPPSGASDHPHHPHAPCRADHPVEVPLHSLRQHGVRHVHDVLPHPARRHARRECGRARRAVHRHAHLLVHGGRR